MHVVAVGGGGFSEGTEPGLEAYLLEVADSPRPRIGFVGTASGDADSYLLKFYKRFAQLNCEASHLHLFRRTPNLEAWVRAQDVVFVGGGNTKSMLAVWAEWGLPQVLRRAAEEDGTILSGISAGAICWFDWGVTDSASAALAPLAGLGFVPGSCCPHYSLEPERRPSYERMVGSGEIVPGYAIDDGAALHLLNGKPLRVVAGHASATVYRTEASADGAVSLPFTDVERVERF